MRFADGSIDDKIQRLLDTMREISNSAAGGFGWNFDTLRPDEQQALLRVAGKLAVCRSEILVELLALGLARRGQL